MIQIRKTHPLFRLLDILMSPLMRLISGSWSELPQETHAWHTQKLTQKEIGGIAQDKMVCVVGEEQSLITEKSIIFFHIPILGGWKRYAVLENTTPHTPWYVGWVLYENGVLFKADIHTLPIHEKRIRLLTGPIGRENHFFAITADGENVPLTLIAQSTIGTPGYGDVRLF